MSLAGRAGKYYARRAYVPESHRMEGIMRSLSRLLLLVALSLTAACGRRPPPADVSPNEGASVQVENRGFSDRTIYVLRSGGDRLRLGFVTGNSTETLAIPAYVLNSAGTLRFIADPIGSREAPVTQEISVRPGDVVGLMIQP